MENEMCHTIFESVLFMKQEEEERKQKQQREALDQMNQHRLDMVCVKQPITCLKGI